MLCIDHIVIGTANLASGIKALEPVFGITIPDGGKHPLMSTHNAIMSTGNREFLEVIAIDETAPAPTRNRWFSLDEPATKERLAMRPRALYWVVETDDLDDVIAKSPIDLGEPLSLSRGDLRWRLSVPQDGSLPEQGIIPAFIEWSHGPHPAQTQADFGIRLKQVKLRHPDPVGMTAIFATLGIDHLAHLEEGPHQISFEMNTAAGTIIID
ncbi:MAG: VOC family protein [Candidatus Puniceispirillaceae bacterium]